MRITTTVLVLLALAPLAQAAEVYKCSLQQLKASKTSLSLKAKPDSKDKDFFMIDGKKATQIDAVQAKMRDGLPAQSE